MTQTIPLRLMLAVSSVVAVIALTYAASTAYFSGTLERDTSISTATVAVGAAGGFPIEWDNLLPGETQEKFVNVRNDSSVGADLYVQLEAGAGDNLCIDGNLNIEIANIAESTVYYDDDPCNLFPGHSNSTIAQIGSNLGPGDVNQIRARLSLDSSAGNDYQDKSTEDTIVLIAVQAGAPAPLANQGDSELWPSGDSNYE